MATAALIPAYEPDEKLIALVRELKNKNFKIIIVDDGSGPEYKKIFEGCLPYADVIGYEKNEGKGYALKFGMSYIQKYLPDEENFLTADADGQHSVQDICRMRDELEKGSGFVISVRNLKGHQIPLLSRIGNDTSRFMFTIANAHFLPDNQSGLRGFSVRHIDWMKLVDGVKYDYELNIILLAEKQGIKIHRISIETIYFNNNSGSHFEPLRDTARIYKTYFKTNIFVLISLVIEIAVAVLSTVFLSHIRIPYFVVADWAIHAILCFVIERYTKFRWISYTPGARRLIISIFKYFVIALLCVCGNIVHIPMFVTFIAAMIMVEIGEYYMLKVTYDNYQ